uniref:Uncharacterized protein n=1 Tax=Romanomermis culicivorax TaxID=13658 RepID=A0A915IX35_ROMCU
IQRVAFGINVDKSKAPDITILVYRYLYPSKFIASLKKTPTSCLLVDEMHCGIAEVRDFSTDALLVEGSSVKLTNLKISQSNYHNKVEVKLQTFPDSTIS